MLTISEAYALACQHFAAGRWPEAGHICSRLLPIMAETETPAILQLLGLVRQAEKQTAAAEALFLRALLLSPDQAIFWSSLGRVHADAQRLEDALSCYHRATQLDPHLNSAQDGLVRVLANLSGVHFAAGRYARAAELAELALAQDPARARIHHNLAIVRAAQGQITMATEATRQAVFADPRFVEAGVYSTGLLYTAGRPAEAMVALTPLLNPTPPIPRPDATKSAHPDANAAIFYHNDGYDTSRPRLMGRHTAGEGFLRGFVQHAAITTCYGYCDTPAAAMEFAATVRRLGGDNLPVRWLPTETPAALAEVGCLYVPDPGIEDYAWRRRRQDQRAYSLCGVTHTTATHAIMDTMVHWLTAPVQSWDAVICTSQAVRATVDTVLTAETDYLRARLGMSAVPTRPQLPVIPLGIAAATFAPVPEQRRAWRQRLDITDNACAVLFMGRLCLHSKGHPLPMFYGLEEAAQRTGVPVHLLLAGWFPADLSEAAFRTLAAELCPSITLHVLDGRTPDVRQHIWAAADVFVSLADNIQETFGLTPLEAMAAGLPVVVSDWDGYRETVRQGEDGFRIPTLTPPVGDGTRLAELYEDGLYEYNSYCAVTAQATAVDPTATANAFTRLVGDAALRQHLGRNGQQRVQTHFDWAVIIRQYQALWCELAARRRQEAESAPRAASQPARAARLDPLRLFATYPSRMLDDATRFTLVAGVSATQVRQRWADTQRWTNAARLLPPESSCVDLVVRVARITSGTTAGEIPGATAGGVLSATCVELLADWPPEQQARGRYALVWLAKMGLLRIMPPPPAPAATT